MILYAELKDIRAPYNDMCTVFSLIIDLLESPWRLKSVTTLHNICQEAPATHTTCNIPWQTGGELKNVALSLLPWRKFWIGWPMSEGAQLIGNTRLVEVGSICITLAEDQHTDIKGVEEHSNRFGGAFGTEGPRGSYLSSEALHSGHRFQAAVQHTLFKAAQKVGAGHSGRG
ncbi:hypothetical protein E2C01_015203 [Portunus trituberculatus]|uniref:Uncharacterized protein n=1 Tax=Portunus trituberculatus TaxID=210409 RepID=A0A5B7DM59_PORTR|nr:hypothetical protein [Portunus trituberculatus]